MKRWWLLPLLLLLLAAVGGAGYLGFRSGRPTQGAAPTAPPTVSVGRGDVQQTVTAPGRLVGTREVMLSFDTTGKLTDLSVRPGAVVQAGATLARLDPVPLAQRVATAQADFDLATARLAKLEAGPSAAELATARLDLANAEARLSQLTADPAAADVVAARAELAAVQAQLAKLKAGPDSVTVQNARYALETAKNNLWGFQVARDAACGGPDKAACDQAQAAVGSADVAVRRAQEELDRGLAGPAADEIQVAQLNVEKAQARLAQLAAPPNEADLKAAQLQQELAQARLTELTAGPSQVDLKQAEAAVRSAQLALEQAQTALQATTLAAPFDGIVLEVRASPGETVTAGASLIRLADASAVEVEATVVEEDFPLIQAGQPVELFFDARPEATIKGRVARIVPQRDAGDSPVYPIYIVLDEAPTGLVPGMTVDASVFIAQRTNVLRLPRSLARARSDGAALVKVWNGLTTEERTVKVGLRGNQYVEIVEGLRAGELVVSR